MRCNVSDSHSHRWGVILAGGDGTRLLPLTRRITGDDRPKQFCSILGNETLLRQTLRRLARLGLRREPLLVLTRTHERFYADELAGIPPSRLLIQPSNQGTAPAILYSLLRLSAMDPNAAVAFFPSDHHFSDDEAFIGHIDSAYSAVAFRPELVILLGIQPDSPEVEYGWIEPGIPLGGSVPNSVCRVSRFWEKPHRTLAVELIARGCLWNSFVMVGHVRSFLNLIRRALPRLFEAFESIRSLIATKSEKAALLDLYRAIPASSFSQGVLSVQPTGLAVLRASGIG